MLRTSLLSRRSIRGFSTSFTQTAVLPTESCTMIRLYALLHRAGFYGGATLIPQQRPQSFSLMICGTTIIPTRRFPQVPCLSEQNLLGLLWALSPEPPKVHRIRSIAWLAGCLVFVAALAHLFKTAMPRDESVLRGVVLCSQNEESLAFFLASYKADFKRYPVTLQRLLADYQQAENSKWSDAVRKTVRCPVSNKLYRYRTDPGGRGFCVDCGEPGHLPYSVPVRSQ